MTTGEFISDGISYQNAGGVQIDDSGIRFRYQRSAQRAVNKAWSVRPPYWRQAASPGLISFAANANQGFMPADFAAPGGQMRVYLQGQRLDLMYEPPFKLFRRIELQSTSTSRRPLFYTLSGEAVSGPNVAQKQIWIYPSAAIPLTLEVRSYLRKPPTLIDWPSPKCVATVGVAGALTGSYTYKVTFVHTNGETEGGAASVAVVPAGNKINLAGIPIATFPGAPSVITGRNIYRTVAGGFQYKLVATLNDNVTTTFLDNVVDGALGANIPTSANAVTGLEQIPDQYHPTVLFDAMLAAVARNKGDARSGMEWPPLIAAGLASMWAEENVKTHVVSRSPRYGGRYRW